MLTYSRPTLVDAWCSFVVELTNAPTVTFVDLSYFAKRGSLERDYVCSVTCEKMKSTYCEADLDT